MREGLRASARCSIRQPAVSDERSRPLPAGDGRLANGRIGLQDRIRRWLKVNDRFRRYILTELERSGPLQAKDLDDRSVEPWTSSGWNNNRNVPLMLEFMEARGEIAVTARDVWQRMWDVACVCTPNRPR